MSGCRTADHRTGAEHSFTSPQNKSRKRTAYQEIAHFALERLTSTGDMEHQIRQKGIFDVILYQSNSQIRGALSSAR
ncbi:MAG: inner membrane CreD family protein [Saprospirales bacterium]|nr:inner membrane CreD family protein [Saprospirales bacterium]